MNSRQEKLLQLVIENHIETAQPVGSKFLVSEAGLDWSEATVRNELRELEEMGYLTHPYTSAGRLPTELGYRTYLKMIDWNKIQPNKKDYSAFENVVNSDDQIRAKKNLAKTLASVSQEAVIIAFSPDSIYYTGLANLFSKPEFLQLGVVADVSQVFDRCEDCLPSFFNLVSEDIRYFIGNEHPFGNLLSVSAFRFKGSMLILLGSMRMEYKRNYSLLQMVKELLNNQYE